MTMKKRYGVFVSSAAVLALATGIFMGKEIFSPDKKETVEPVIQPEAETKTEAPRQNAQGQQKILTIYDIEDGYMQVPYLEKVKKHSYDWSKLHEKDGLKYYIDGAGNVSKAGIDVSYFQENIDWDKVKASGIEFAMLRAGYRGYSPEGKLVVDEKFHQYMQEAQAAGLSAGVYFFSQAVNKEEAVEEAVFVAEQCRDYKLDLPVVFDTEKIKEDTGRTDGLKPEELTEITIAFCEKIKEYGYEPMIYANAKWLTTKLLLERLAGYQFWYADYQEQPLYPYDFQMWQYTETGRVDGIEGNVDINIWFP